MSELEPTPELPDNTPIREVRFPDRIGGSFAGRVAVAVGGDVSSANATPACFPQRPPRPFVPQAPRYTFRPASDRRNVASALALSHRAGGAAVRVRTPAVLRRWPASPFGCRR
jgi:hypothetical protein